MSQNEPLTLEVAIVRTLAWFSLFDYPLTAFEIWKWLGLKSSLAEVEQVLQENNWLRERLSFKDGFFVLAGRPIEALITIHQERFLNATKKFKKLRRAARFFSLFPFVRAVFACNTLSWHHTTPESDIDLFIVVAPGTIWLSRLLLVVPFALLRIRPFPKGKGGAGGVVDPFCFSFFITADNLSLEKILLADSDPYMAYWLASLVPIFDHDSIQNKLWQENEWLKKFLPNVFPQAIHKEISLKYLFTLPLSFLLKFEAVVGYWQKKFLPCEIRDNANQDSRVVISHQMLKFHTNDRRSHFRDEWQKIVTKNL